MSLFVLIADVKTMRILYIAQTAGKGCMLLFRRGSMSKYNAKKNCTGWHHFRKQEGEQTLPGAQAA